VGTRGVGIMNSMDFSLLANSNPGVHGNQEMDLTIGSLNFCVRSSGSTRLSDPAKPDPSASETKTISLYGSSVGSSSEVNSPVSFTTTGNTGEKIEELNETMENLDIGGTLDQSYPSQKDFITRSGGVSSNIHQVCIIITEAADKKDDIDNIATRKQTDKSRSNSKKEKEKIHISTGEWRIIMSAINHGMEVPANSRREVLMGYEYALHRHKKKLREEEDEFRRSQENNSVSSGAY
jgi:F0F1-type ATP synthase epsilon subunit